MSDEEYKEQVNFARLFLKGKNQQVIGSLVKNMEKASEALNFEAAARYRDQINALRKVQERQWVAGTQDNMDVFGFAFKGNMACIQVMFIREGQLLGSKAFFPKVPNIANESEVFESFFLQFYLAGNKTIPRQIVMAHTLSDEAAIVELLSSEANHKVTFFKGAREEKRQYLELAQTNAESALDAQYSQQKSVFARYLDLEEAMEVDSPIQRMECFDISHTSGQQTVASCVVFNREGPLKSDYRRYNIEGITPGDDYAAESNADIM